MGFFQKSENNKSFNSFIKRFIESMIIMGFLNILKNNKFFN